MPAPRVGLHEEREERRDPIDPRRQPGHTEEKGKPGRLLEQEQFVVCLYVARLQQITTPSTQPFLPSVHYMHLSQHKCRQRHSNADG